MAIARFPSRLVRYIRGRSPAIIDYRQPPCHRKRSTRPKRSAVFPATSCCCRTRRSGPGPSVTEKAPLAALLNASAHTSGGLASSKGLRLRELANTALASSGKRPYFGGPRPCDSTTLPPERPPPCFRVGAVSSPDRRPHAPHGHVTAAPYMLRALAKSRADTGAAGLQMCEALPPIVYSARKPRVRSSPRRWFLPPPSRTSVAASALGWRDRRPGRRHFVARGSERHVRFTDAFWPSPMP